VTAYALIAKGTLEEAIVEMGEGNAAIFNAVMDGSTSSSLSLEDIHELFRRRQ
jgi:SNF2 family DNA or RNA helicase